MTERIKKLLQILKSGDYKKNWYHREITLDEETRKLSPVMQDAMIFKTVLDNETPYLHEGERIGFNRTNTAYYQRVFPDGTLRRAGAFGNAIPDYETMLHNGMDALKSDIEEKLLHCRADQREFLQAALFALNRALLFADSYADFAKQSKNEELYQSLCQVPHKGARTLLEACVFMKFIIFTIRSNRNIHVPLGRFDQYMRPFYEADLKAGRTREELLETIEEFFLSINFDSELYQGAQQGDNGQSLVLGGNGSFDDFSHLCMEASLALNLIDPKINLRVDKNTPDDLYEFATLMTKQGLGFPQYCNDDVVIPGLIDLGYAPEDAADYAVAACWEFIIPGKGADVPNIVTMNFPAVVNHAVLNYLQTCNTFEELMEKVKEGIIAECNVLMDHTKKRKPFPTPYFSLFLKGCIETGKDVTENPDVLYKNYGCHGAGIATAADSLAAIKEVIFETREYTKEQLLDALRKDFEGYNELQNRLLSCPKMGNNDERTDKIAYTLMDAFSGYLNGKPNSIGGIFRAGTGSAQEYWFSAQKVGATADGRKAKHPYGSSYSPSLEARLSGPLSCIKSFTGFDLKKIINGGPLTIEIHNTVFRNDDGIKKVAQLVKAFITLGGHQLQLNTINRDILLDAMEHPENHKNLIVRVWGWSGYFTELDLHFREHIIKRTEFTM